MSNSICKVTLFIPVIIYAAFFCFVFAADSLAEDKFDSSSFRAKIEELKKDLSPQGKLELARCYFSFGYLYHTAAILDIGVKIDDYSFLNETDDYTFLVNLVKLIPSYMLIPEDLKKLHEESPDPVKLTPSHMFIPEDLKKLHEESPEQRAQASMYLGYTYLSIGKVSEALENFAAAFKFNPYLEYKKAALRHESLEEIIKASQIADQMKHPPLDLFVVVDVSKSVSREQKENIIKLQREIGERLMETDRILFQPFGNTPYEFNFKFSAYSPSLSIVEPLRTDLQTNFIQLFDELAAAIKKRKTNGTTKDSVKRKTVILIISDGEHSPDKHAPSQQGASIPPGVVPAIGRFSTNSDNIPIVMLIVDRMFQGVVVGDSDYADEWAQKLTEYNVGQSIYYGQGSELEVILKQIFDIIAPQRNRIVVQHAPKSGYQRFFFDDPEPYTVNLKIESELPNVHLRVEGPSPWGSEYTSSFGSSIWQQYRLSEITEKNILPITSQGITSESVEITPGSKFRNVFNNSYSQIFLLTFHQLSAPNMDRTDHPIGGTPLLFHKTKPEVQIAQWSRLENKVLLKSKGKSDLEFQAKIKSPSSRFRQPIPLRVTISENNCFSMIGAGITEQVEIIAVDTASYSRWQKFKVPIKAENIDDSGSRQSMGNITINFQIDEGNKEHQIGNKGPETDVLATLKPDILVVKEWIYCLYKVNTYLWIPFPLIFILAVFYPLFAKIYRLTEMLLDDSSIRREGFNVHGHTIYDSNGQLVLRLRQCWWFSWLEQVGENPKSNIEKATLLTLSSEKSRKLKEKDIKLSNKKYFIWPTRRYQIILPANGRSSKFNIDCNYTIKIWYKRIKRFLIWFIVPTFILMVGCICVFWHWYPRFTVGFLAISLILFMGWVIHVLRRNGQDQGVYEWSILRGLSSIFSIFDGSIGIVEFLWQFII